MAIIQYQAGASPKLKHSLNAIALELLAHNIVAIQRESYLVAAILPWADVEAVCDIAKAVSGHESFLQDAKTLASIVENPAILEGPPSRKNAVKISKEIDQVLESCEHGRMTTFVYHKSAVGIFVPPVVLSVIAEVKGRNEAREIVLAGLLQAVIVEESFHDWRYTSPANRAKRGMSNPAFS